MKELRVEGWKIPVVIAMTTIILTLATIGGIVVVYTAVVTYDRVTERVKVGIP
jgi:hypothetical protein